MIKFFIKENMDIDDENTDERVCEKQSIGSLSPKSSKLCGDKGNVKPQDVEKFRASGGYKSTRNVFAKIGNDFCQFGDTMMTKSKQPAYTKRSTQQIKPFRRRFLSDPNEFSLLPLLRKISNSDVSDDHDAFRIQVGEDFAENLDLPHKIEEDEFFITIGDVQPGV